MEKYSPIAGEIFKQLQREKRKKKNFYVTDLGKCPRKVIMDFGDYEKKPLTDSELLMFGFADYIHVKLTSLIKKSNKYAVIAEELSVNEGLPEQWHGRLDTLLFDLEDKIFLPIEWKSTRSFVTNMDLPKNQHYYQVLAYLYALNRMGYEVETGIILYVDRTGSNKPIECVVVRDDDEFTDMCVTYNNYLATYLDKKILPEMLPRELKNYKSGLYLHPNWQCQYCHFQDISCKPNMSKNKIGNITNGKLIKGRNWGRYEDEVDRGELNKLLNPEEIEDFGEYCKAISD